MFPGPLSPEPAPAGAIETIVFVPKGGQKKLTRDDPCLEWGTHNDRVQQAHSAIGNRNYWKQTATDLQTWRVDKKILFLKVLLSYNNTFEQILHVQTISR